MITQNTKNYDNNFVCKDNGTLCIILSSKSEEECKDILDIAKGKILNTDGLKKVQFVVPKEKLSKPVFEKVLELNQVVGSLVDMKFLVNHTYEDRFGKDQKDIEWNIKTIISANQSIDSVCDFIEQNKLSPFEALAYIHDYVSTVAKYNESHFTGHDWYNRDQHFAGVFMNIPEVVCTGYSSLMKEIIDNLNMPELSCELVSFQFNHVEEWYTSRHTRCFIKIKDEKYGLDQTLFDDATWDNNQELVHKYAHFAMPNNCFDISVSKMYEYYTPYIVYHQESNTIRSQQSALNETYNNSVNAIDQNTVEIAYFNMLTAKYKQASFDDVYNILQQMAKVSYTEQTERQYVGNLKSEKLSLSKSTAKKYYTAMHNQDINQTEYKTQDFSL